MKNNKDLTLKNNQSQNVKVEKDKSLPRLSFEEKKK